MVNFLDQFDYGSSICYIPCFEWRNGAISWRRMSSLLETSPVMVTGKHILLLESLHHGVDCFYDGFDGFTCVVWNLRWVVSDHSHGAVRKDMTRS